MMVEGLSTVADSSGVSPLRKYFEQNIKVSEMRGRVQCHVLTDNYRPEDWLNEGLGPRRGTREYLLARHTILVYISCIGGGSFGGRPSPNSSPNKRRTSEHVLVMGMTTFEYAANERPGIATRAYIQYVDTTGLCKPRRLQGSLTRTVISTYLRYCREVIKVSHVHLLALAKPSLLFNESEMLPRKKILDGAALINWWLALIHTSFAGPAGVPSFVQASYQTPQAFVYFASEESFPLFLKSIKNNIAVLNLTGTGVEWKCGIPYDPDHSHEIIPLFEDDPKWRHFEASMEIAEERPTKRQKRETETTSVHEFFKSMSFRMEFRQDPSAFVVLCFPENSSPSFTAPLYHNQIRKNEVASFACKLLKTMTFHTESEAIKSSMRLWSWLKLMGTNPIELSTDGENTENLLKDRRFHELASNLCLRSDFSIVPTSIGSNNNTTTTTTTDVQTLIRRKVPRS